MKHYAGMTSKIQRRKGRQFVAIFAIGVADLILFFGDRRFLVPAQVSMRFAQVRYAR
jgi:hypothetical protein